MQLAEVFNFQSVPSKQQYVPFFTLPMLSKTLLQKGLEARVTA